MLSFKAAILYVLGMLVLLNISAQQRFYAQSVENLYYALPGVCAVTDTAMLSAVVLCFDVVGKDTVTLIYRWDENRVLDHIGYHFLAGDASIDNAIVQFIERELLKAILSVNINQTLITWQENGLSVQLNGTQIKQSLLQNKKQLLSLLKNNSGIEINYDGANYDATLYCASGQELSFHFKSDSELITGMDKKERDARLFFQLKNHRASSDSITDNRVASDYSYLKLLRDSLYVDKGSSFIIPQINNDLVYIKADSSYNLAHDKSLIGESFANALLVPVGKNYKIDITHRLYGNVVRKYTIESCDFDDYFLRDYDRYFGIESLEKEKQLKGTLILSDRNAGSIHLAFVSVTMDDLLNGGTMEMQLYSNIPQQNVKTLFGKQ